MNTIVEVPGLSDVVGSTLEPQEDYDEGYLYGRFNPLSNNHVAMAEYVADEYDLDRLNMTVVNGGGTPRSPMYPEEVVEAVERTFEGEGRGFDVEVNQHNIEDMDSFMWRNNEVPDKAVYYTADIEHAILGKLRQFASNNNFSIDYEPRYNQDFKEGEEIPNSGTEVKEEIREGGEWKRYVPEGTIEVIDDNPEIIDRVREGDPSRGGKQMEILFGDTSTR